MSSPVIPSLPLEAIVDRRHFYAGRLENLPESFREYRSSHRHPHHAVFFFTGGKGDHVIDFHRHRIEPPVVFFVKASQVHSWIFESSVSGFAMKLSEAFFIDAGVATAFQKFSCFSVAPPSSALFLREETAALISDFNRLVDEYDGERNPAFLGTMAGLILLQLDREFKQQYGETDRASVSTYERFLAMLEDHFIDQKSAMFYARQLGINPGVLNRYCQRASGRGTKALIHDRLLLEIRRLLMHSDLSFTEVAFHLKFSDAAYFSRYVKKHIGQAPGEIRASARNVQ